MQNNNSSLGGGSGSNNNGGGGAAQPSADMEQQQHGGKDSVLGAQAEPPQQPQQMLNKGADEEEMPGKMGEPIGGRYDHPGLGPLGGQQQPQQPPPSAGSGGGGLGGGGGSGGGGGGPSAVGVSEFNSYYGNAAPASSATASRAGPCFDQHGGQQSPGMGIMHPTAAPNSMDPLQNSHEGYPNSQYNHYPGYGRGPGGGGGAGAVAAAAAAGAGGGGYGGSAAGYGVLSSPRQPGGGMMMGPGGGAGLGKAAAGAGAGGFARFSGQNQHPSGATPTLNQLLTSPSPMMRSYGSSYPDYSSPSAPPQPQPQAAAAAPGSQQAAAGMGMGKDMGAQYGAANPAWATAQQRNHPAMSPGNTGQAISRTQVSPRARLMPAPCHSCRGLSFFIINFFLSSFPLFFFPSLLPPPGQFSSLPP